MLGTAEKLKEEAEKLKQLKAEEAMEKVEIVEAEHDLEKKAIEVVNQMEAEKNEEQTENSPEELQKQ